MVDAGASVLGWNDDQGILDRRSSGGAGAGSRAPQRRPGREKAQLLTDRASRRQVRRTIVAAALFTVGLAGCGGSDGDGEPNGRPAAAPSASASASASLAASGDTSSGATIGARQPTAVAASATGIPVPATGGATHGSAARGSVGAGSPARGAAAAQPARIPPSPIPAGNGGAGPPPAAASAAGGGAGSPQGLSRTFYGANSPGENLPQHTAGPNASSGGRGLVVTYPPASPFVVPQCHKPLRCHDDSDRQATPAPSSPTGAAGR